MRRRTPLHVFLLVFAAIASTLATTVRQQPNAQQYFLPAAQFPRLLEEAIESTERLTNTRPQFVHDVSFREQTDIIFRGLRGLENESNVLEPQPTNGTYLNSLSQFFIKSHFTDPFQQRVPSNARVIREIFNDVTNGSASDGDVWHWFGGLAATFRIGSSRIYALVNTCTLFTIQDADGEITTPVHIEFIRQQPPQQSVLMAIEQKNSPVTCSGSGLAFQDHGQKSQRMWLAQSNETPQKIGTVGIINEGDLASGSIIQVSPTMLENLNRLEDGDEGVPGISNIFSRFTETESDFESSLGSYNNMAFLIVSIATVLSSTAVAVVTDGSGWADVAVVVVESTVVYSFLAILTHACVSFTREDSFLVDSADIYVGNYTYQSFTLKTQSEVLFTAVGERVPLPALLILAEVFVILAALVATFTVIRIFIYIKRTKKLGKERNDPENLEESSVEKTV